MSLTPPLPICVACTAIFHDVAADYTAFLEDIPDQEASNGEAPVEAPPKRRMSRLDSFGDIEFHTTTLPVHVPPKFDFDWEGEHHMCMPC